jgi:DNA-binding transcriptional ArsR family regulator
MGAQRDTQAVRALDLLGDATRRRILEMLQERPRPVGALASQLPVSRPAVSKHLRVMKEAGLVADEVAGTRRIYRIRPEGFRPIAAYWDRFWTGALDSFNAHAEQREQGMQGPVVRKELTIGRSIDESFHLFTAEVGQWWPFDEGHSLFSGEATGAVIQPFAGGRLYEVSRDGQEAEWGSIVRYEPPGLLEVRWHPGRAPEHATTWAVRLEAIDIGTTRLELIHTGWEVRGEDAAESHADYSVGWDFVLGQFASHAA